MARPRSATAGAAEAVDVIVQLKKRMKLSDEAIAERIAVDQSSVCRALKRNPPAWTPTLQKLSHYAETLGAARSKSARAHSKRAPDVLAKAAFDAWDGTAPGLEWLVRLLRLVAESQKGKR